MVYLSAFNVFSVETALLEIGSIRKRVQPLLTTASQIPKGESRFIYARLNQYPEIRVDSLLVFSTDCQFDGSWVEYFTVFSPSVLLQGEKR